MDDEHFVPGHVHGAAARVEGIALELQGHQTASIDQNVEPDDSMEEGKIRKKIVKLDQITPESILIIIIIVIATRIPGP